MPNQPKRNLTSRDIQKIADLWRRYQSLRSLRKSALASTAKGAWIKEAAQIQMDLIASELESLFEETFAPEMDD